MRKLNIVIYAASIVAALNASASVVTTFGSLPPGAFGGSGNPTDAVEITTINDGSGNTVTLGLAAQQRYQNPVLGNNGNGTYTAGIGANYGDPANPSSQANSTLLGSTWNFDFYANIAGGGNLNNYSFVLNYQLTPGGPIGSLYLNALAEALGAPATTTTLANSENLDFSFLATSVLNQIAAPSGGPFNPNAIGDYSFSLDAYNSSDVLIGQSEIDVNVVPEPTTVIAGALLLVPFGLSIFRSFRRRQAA